MNQTKQKTRSLGEGARYFWMRGGEERRKMRRKMKMKMWIVKETV